MAAGKKARMIEQDHRQGLIRVPFVEIEGARDGPTLAAVAGVHGSEYVGITAAMMLAQTLDPLQLRGRVRIVTIANVPGYLARSMHINPVDGQNLGRCFPGDPAGSYGDAVAAVVFDAAAKGADYLIDLHGGDLEEELAAYSSWPETGNEKVDRLSERLAHVVDYPRILKKSKTKEFTRGGLYDAAAHLLGVPAILVEAGSHGELDTELVELQFGGLTNALIEFDMIDGTPTHERHPVYLSGFVSVKSPIDGAFYPSVHAGDLIAKGATLGELRDLFGTAVGPVLSPMDAVVLGIITTTAMPRDAMVAGLGTLAEPFIR